MASEAGSPVTTTSGPWNNSLLLEEFRQAMQAVHNKHRADHGSAGLKLSEYLNGYATEWAQISAEIEDCIHRPEKNYGENLHKCYWVDTTIGELAQIICEDFYNEIEFYDFDAGEYVDDAAHFTQLVWYDSIEFGVGIAQGESGFVYCVVNYTPQGNVEDGFTSNVLPLGTPYKPKPVLCDQSVFIPPPVVTRLSISHDVNLFRKLATNQHNIYRKLHSAPFLVNVHYLNEVSQKWAEYLAETDTYMHSDNGYGENIFEYYSTDTKEYPTIIDVCKKFKDEGKEYDYEENTNAIAPHFTQMIWKDSKELGIGIKKSANGRVFVVFNYNPPGNVEGKYISNVSPPQPNKNQCIKVCV